MKIQSYKTNKPQAVRGGRLVSAALVTLWCCVAVLGYAANQVSVDPVAQTAQASVETPNASGQVMVNAAQKTVSAQVQGGGTTYQGTINDSEKSVHVGMATPGNTGSADVNLRDQTASMGVAGSGFEGKGAYDAKKGELSTSVKTDAGSGSLDVNARQQQANVDVETAAGKGNVAVDLKQQQVSGKITDAQGNVTQGQLDLSKGQAEAHTVSADGLTTDTTLDAKKGTLNTSVTTDAGSGSLDVNAKKQQFSGNFTDAQGNSFEGQADLKKGRAEVHTEGVDGLKTDTTVDAKKGTLDVHAEKAVSGNFKSESNLGTAQGSYTAGAEADGHFKVGKDSVDAKLSAQVGLAAELQAVSSKMGMGDENAGLSVQAKAEVEALIGAKASIGLHIDNKGITIGIDAAAGAYVSAKAEINFEAHVLGLQVNVTAYAEGSAGLVAEGKAVVHIGYDGKIRFKLGAGVSFGIGGAVGLEFEIDASQLMEKFGLPDLGALMDWINRFVEDPAAALRDLIKDAGTALLDMAKKKVAEVVDHVIDEVKKNVGSFLGNLISEAASGLGVVLVSDSQDAQSTNSQDQSLPSNREDPHQPVQNQNDVNPSRQTGTDAGAGKAPYQREYGTGK